jgi:hypothetical protein
MLFLDGDEVMSIAVILGGRGHQSQLGIDSMDQFFFGFVYRGCGVIGRIGPTDNLLFEDDRLFLGGWDAIVFLARLDVGFVAWRIGKLCGGARFIRLFEPLIDFFPRYEGVNGLTDFGRIASLPIFVVVVRLSIQRLQFLRVEMEETRTLNRTDRIPRRGGVVFDRVDVRCER